MNVLGPILFLVVCLGLQAGLARLMPTVASHVDLMALPVVWYAIVRSQRSAMLVGAAAGLLQDAWFQAGVFGLGGFCKTFLGWLLGGAASRFDLNNPSSQFVTGALFSIAQRLLELGLRRLMDQVTAPPSILFWIVDALIAGVLVVVGFKVVERVTGRQQSGSAFRRGF